MAFAFEERLPGNDYIDRGEEGTAYGWFVRIYDNLDHVDLFYYSDCAEDQLLGTFDTEAEAIEHYRKNIT